ncbi:energy-coupling factor transporter transmembrane protein EcfT [Micromonospora yasonensis]|uniref:energy-coupling factor transporter transmembrane component T family protein n=1 Tax=Micromonospora yasonensis TaxID=1128667 RepID=UPI002230CAAF|nr:energy-coupling factor transporter transmembrane component T [Micromonospora yasonensis]MCW3842762.1 energy-coupling factor transporter transmembrane protein EcfT [Micromonospora yasonensis]
MSALSPEAASAPSGGTFDGVVSHGNWIRDMHPLNVAVVLASISLLALATPRPVGLVSGCVAFLGIAVAAGVGGSFARLYAKLVVGVGLVLFVLRAAFVHGNHVLFELGPLAPTWEGVREGTTFALVVMALCGALTLYFVLVPMKTFMLALELKGMPPQATYILLASFQAITDLGRSARTVMDAQKSRGIETEGNLWVRARAFVPILAPVFITALNQTEERAIALDARAFNSGIPHTHVLQLRPAPAWERAATALTAAACLATIGAGLLWT